MSSYQARASAATYKDLNLAIYLYRRNQPHAYIFSHIRAHFCRALHILPRLLYLPLLHPSTPNSIHQASQIYLRRPLGSVHKIVTA